MIPPTKRPGSVVVTRPASHGEVPGSNPGLVVLFSLTVPEEGAFEDKVDAGVEEVPDEEDSGLCAAVAWRSA